eukprot:m.280818 g.280818  ORF g.280818 m.280818 type:complete len:851 (-) comp26976_c1_seq11:121-2673(-)
MNTGSACIGCDRSVYAAEGVTLDGRVWHKGCFACEECGLKLTLQTYFVFHGLQHIFCKKCGPVLLPKLDAEGVEFRRFREAKGHGRRVNDQIRGERKGERRLSFTSFRKRSSDSGPDGPGSPGTADADDDDDDDGDDGGGVFDAPEIDVAGPVTHSGEESSGYHESGHPIYGNLPGYYADSAASGGGGAAVVEAPVKLRSGEKVQYTAVSVGSSAQAATRKRNSGLERVASGSSGAVFVTGQASDSAKTTLPMTFSSEETYDNPAVASAAFKSGTDGFLPGSAYDMSGTSEPPHSPRAVSSDQYNTDVRNGLVDPMQATAASLASLDLSPHPAALEDVDYGQPCQTCKTCPGFMLHRWRKVCQMCRCSRMNHRSKEITERRRSSMSDPKTKRTGKDAYTWSPSGCDLKLVESYFGSIAVEYVPRIGTEGELWRREQILLQLPAYDTDVDKSNVPGPNHGVEMKKLDEVRLRAAFDVGEVLRCPDFSRPDECEECKLREDGTHWAYCSKFIDPDLEKRTIGKKGGAKKGGTAIDDSAIWAQMDPTEAAKMRSIKEMKQKGMPATLTRKPSVTFGGAGGGGGDGGGTSTEALIDAGKRCHGCSRHLYIGYPVVSCGRFEDEEVFFHPTCFSCSECGELLVDLRAFIDVGKEERGEPSAPKRLFCGRHWCNNMYPRCATCDESILQQDYVHELTKSYHIEHFCCSICDANLTQLETFVPRGRKPYCFPCYGVHFADKCKACTKPINPGKGFGGKVSIGKDHWHGGCYKCHRCGDGLAGKPCIPRDDGLWCKPCLKESIRKAKESKLHNNKEKKRGGRAAAEPPPAPAAAPPPRRIQPAPIYGNDDADSDGMDV